MSKVDILKSKNTITTNSHVNIDTFPMKPSTTNIASDHKSIGLIRFASRTHTRCVFSNNRLDRFSTSSVGIVWSTRARPIYLVAKHVIAGSFGVAYHSLHGGTDRAEQRQRPFAQRLTGNARRCATRRRSTIRHHISRQQSRHHQQLQISLFCWVNKSNDE
jgi:hypothetical protein